MHNDLEAMNNVLRQRGFVPEEILSLEGPLDRPSLMTFLAEVHQRTASWSHGEVFLYYGGHGIFTGTEVSAARPALWLSNGALLCSTENCVFWDEVISALGLPPPVTLILLPDS